MVSDADTNSEPCTCVPSEADIALYRSGIGELLATARGQLGAVGRMVEDGRDCPSILHQLSAVQGELDRVRRDLLAAHLGHCLSGIPAEQASKIVSDVLTAVYRGSPRPKVPPAGTAGAT